MQYDPRLVRKGCGRIYLLDKVGIIPVLGSGEGLQVVYEGSLRFKPEILNVKTNCVLHGYWQSEKYFQEIQGIIRQEVFNQIQLSARTRLCASLIGGTFSQDDKSCFIHIRRSDCLRPAGISVHGLINEAGCKYYERTIAYMREKIPGIRFFVFSDDPEWIKENMTDPDMTVVTHNTWSGYTDATNEVHDREGGTEHEDLWLMSLCRHAIIANSSFSWWGAWLNKREGEGPYERIVLAPEPWFNATNLDSTDIIPERWRKIAVR